MWTCKVWRPIYSTATGRHNEYCADPAVCFYSYSTAIPCAPSLPFERNTTVLG
jgi:hypothetical protein